MGLGVALIGCGDKSDDCCGVSGKLCDSSIGVLVVPPGESSPSSSLSGNANSAYSLGSGGVSGRLLGWMKGKERVWRGKMFSSNVTSVETIILRVCGSHNLYPFDAISYPTKMSLSDVASNFFLVDVMYL